VALARVPIWLDPVAATKRSEETPVPLIDELEVGLYRFFDLFGGGECFPHPVDCRRRRVTLSCGSGSLEQSGDLTQLLAEFLFSSHGYGRSRNARIERSLPVRGRLVPPSDLRNQSRLRIFKSF
jgi:hypothetical protein